MKAAIYGGAATVIAAIIGASVLLFTDDPPTPPPTPPQPTTQRGEITDVNVAVGTPCCTWSVQFEAEGFKGHICTLEATAYDALTGAPGAPLRLDFNMTADRDRGSAPAAVDLSSGGGRNFYMIFRLLDPHGLELARRQTQPFGIS